MCIHRFYDSLTLQLLRPLCVVVAVASVELFKLFLFIFNIFLELYIAFRTFILLLAAV